MPTVKVDDITIYYEMHGEGEPFVLIEGLGTDLSIYRPIIDRLSDRFQVLAFDNRGVGRTDKPDSPYTIEMMADDTATLMSEAGIGRAHVMGVSMGGRIAMALALRHPDRVQSLILVSTFPTVENRLPLLPKLIKRVRAAISKSAQPYYAFLRQLQASHSYDARGQLSQIHVPTLILHGERDDYQQAEAMHAGIKDSKIVRFRGGHMFFLWENKQLVDTILAFLGGVEKA